MINHPKNGFTLVELMIAIAIAAILGSLAMTAYNGYVSSSRESALL